MSVELKPIKTKKIYEEIVEQIKQLIMDGYLKPGDKLPSEKNLVESFKVSRSSIREALSALEIMGLVEVRTGEGAFIRRLEEDSIPASFYWLLSLDTGSVRELLELRKMVEVQAAGYAAERITPDELVRLGQVLEAMKNDLPIQPLAWEKADYLFHYHIAEATHNKMTVRLVDTLSKHFQNLLKLSYGKLYESAYTLELLYREHEEIYLAIKERDVERTRGKMLKHLLGVEDIISEKTYI